MRVHLKATLGGALAGEGVPVLIDRKGATTALDGGDPVAVEIEVLPGGDLGGPWVSGPKGQRFVYLGLPGDDGGWRRRWKWRAEQLSSLRDGDRVTLRLGAAVTPEMSVEGGG